MKIKMFEIVGDFGEDKDAAAELREKSIKPCIRRKELVSIDFRGVTLVTQSFIHALISDVLRINGEGALRMLEFKNCADVVKGIISTVVQYSLDSASEEPASTTPTQKRRGQKRPIEKSRVKSVRPNK